MVSESSSEEKATGRKKKEANEFGRFAEEMAAQRYINQGYTVLERGWRMGKTEIDLILQKEDTVVIVEVKARGTNEEDALQSVTADKRKRMIRAADHYIRGLKGQYDYRFDVVACVGDRNNYELNFFEDAFMATDIF